MRLHPYLLLGCVALAALAPPVHAVPVAFDFDAVVIDASDAPADLAAGALLSGTLVYDAAAISNGVTPGGSGSLTESYSYTLSGLSVLSIAFASSATAATDAAGTAIVRDFPDGSLFTDGFVVQGFAVSSPLAINSLQYSASQGNFPTGPISATALTPTLPQLGWTLDEINFFTSYNSGLPGGRIRADITGILPAAIPEPSTGLLVAGGLATLAWRRTRTASKRARMHQ